MLCSGLIKYFTTWSVTRVAAAAANFNVMFLLWFKLSATHILLPQQPNLNVIERKFKRQILKPDPIILGLYCWVSSPGGCHVLSLLDPEFPRQLAPSSLLPVYVLLHLLQSREGTLFNLSKMMMKIIKCCQNKIDELTKKIQTKSD